MSGAPIVPVPAPWKLKGTVYTVTFWCKAGQLPDFAYSPLEAASAYADPKISGQHHGGTSQLQVIRYTESPVGPYDEMIIIPGFFDYRVEENGKVKTKKNARVTRIYVSQNKTCWNGRKNWNIPKHLARFDFQDLPDGSTKIRVYPHDTCDGASEVQASNVPFFQAIVQPLRWAPPFPFSASWLGYAGLDISLVQPPLPEGNGSQGELPGTDKWCKILPGQASNNTSLAWIDLSQRDEQGALNGQNENFWPNLGRWQLGVKMENCDIDFGEGVYWSAL
ncbi:hypothetical protein PFICI_01073 [Pestalotiopsis fici W106-1]|uniref:Uncharacterized protein n=1 Tax=Pestalotiopsis fici (strain W106-1 / CGMCC3.15140) TaxID=1229662 RepID=W3XMT8_PESFW|nr:uncharacterized protein PFICI_01073 [Pestalotiopsis fici W106-1]ETS87245.1 hypothetical protein PFICI_01073 [Pestalotiopsis fici W106-1]